MKAIKTAGGTMLYPRLPADLLCIKSEGGIAALASAGAILLQGEDARFVVETLFPLLDGTRTEPEIIAELPSLAPDDVRNLLQTLQDHGLLSCGPQSGLARPSAAQLLALLQAAKVLLVGARHRTASAAVAFRDAGIGTIKSELRDFDGIDIAVGIFDERDTQQGHDFASILHGAGIRSLTCMIGRTETTIGPLAIPRRTACWNCGRLRLQANTKFNNAAEQCADTEGPFHGIDQHLARAVCDALCLGDGGSPLTNHVLVFDALSVRTSLHPVLPIPACRVCGGPTTVRRLSHKNEPDRSDDAMFNLSLQMLSWFVDNRTGIVNRVVIECANDTGELPVIATAITAAAPDETAPARQMPIGWGKGCDAASAVVGAVAEAIERYSGSMPDAARIIWSRPGELAGDALHPRELALYSGDQFERPSFPYVRFDPELAHPWIAGEWADEHGAVWIPAVLVFLSLDIRREQAFCQGTSNGMAAGTEISEVQLRAILELLERDAFMTSWLCKRPGRLLRIDGTLDANLKTVLDGAAGLGAQVELVLLQSACGYPTVACLGFGDGISWPGVTFGLGTDPDPRSAVRQAILEFGQTGPYLRKMMTSAAHLIPKTASGVSDMLDHARYYFPPERARAFDYLRDGSDACALADLPEGSERSLKACVGTLAASNIRVALVDVTSADVATTGFVAIRAVSPDLQPISFGYGLDRLPVARLMALGAEVSDVSPIW
jgi:ribosomal protein S12 methylthiotransferase accessory factor